MSTKFTHLFFIFIPFLLFGCATTKEPLKVTIESRALWEAAPPRPFKVHIPERITVHHEGTFFDPAKQSAAEHIKRVQTWGMGPDRNWIDIPYHFLIDFDGKIYEGRNVFTVGETNTEYDPSGHLLISCLGNFEEQEVGEKTLNALVDLIAYSCRKFDISPDSIRTHRDYAKTSCPGKNMYKYFSDGTVVKRVKEILKSRQIQGI